MVVVRVAGSFTTATCCHTSVMISPDQFTRSPFDASASRLVHWNSRRLEMPRALGEAVQSHRVSGTPICERLPVLVSAFDQPFREASQSASIFTNVSIV